MDPLVMHGSGLVARVNGLRNVHGDDLRPMGGGDIGEPAGPASGIQNQFAFQPIRRPLTVVQKAFFRQMMTAQAVNLQCPPFLPLKSKIFAVIISWRHEPGDAIRDRVGGATAPTNERSIADFRAAITALDGYVQVWSLARWAGQEIKKFATHVI